MKRLGVLVLLAAACGGKPEQPAPAAPKLRLTPVVVRDGKLLFEKLNGGEGAPATSRTPSGLRKNGDNPQTGTTSRTG